MKIIRTIIAVWVIMFIIAIHEFGHALALWRYGFTVETFSIGWTFGVLPQHTFHLPMIPETTFAISALPIGGYVRTSQAVNEQISQQPYLGAVVASAGVWLNLLTSSIVIIGYNIVKKKRVALFPVAVLGITVFSALYPACFTIIAFPLCSLFIYLALCSFKEARIEGPISITRDVSESVKRPGLLIKKFADISLAIGLLNALPIFPLDGNRFFVSIMQLFGLAYEDAILYGLSSSIVLPMIIVLSRRRSSPSAQKV